MFHLLARLRDQQDALMNVLGIGRVNLVTDTNFVIEELSWLSRKRRDPSVPGRFAELSRTGLIRFYAPPRLASEVEEHIPDLAKKWRVPEEDLWTCWSELEKWILFHEHTGSAKILNPERDPNDHDFIHLQNDLSGAPVITCDSDIKDMGGRVLSSEYSGELNIYLQDKRIEIAMLATETAIVALFGYGGWKAISAGIPYLFKALRNPVVLGILGGLFFVYLISPRVRKYTNELATSAYHGVGNIFSVLGTAALAVGCDSLHFRTLGNERMMQLAVRYPGAPFTEFAETFGKDLGLVHSVSS